MCLVNLFFLITRALQCKYLSGAGQVALLSLSCVPVFRQSATQLCLENSCLQLYRPYCTREVGIDSQAYASSTDSCGSWQFWSMARVYALGCLTLNPTMYHIMSQRIDAVNTYTRLTDPTHGDKFYMLSSISARSSLSDITLLTLFDRKRVF